MGFLLSTKTTKFLSAFASAVFMAKTTSFSDVPNNSNSANINNKFLCSAVLLRRRADGGSGQEGVADVTIEAAQGKNSDHNGSMICARVSNDKGKNPTSAGNIFRRVRRNDEVCVVDENYVKFFKEMDGRFRTEVDKLEQVAGFVADEMSAMRWDELEMGWVQMRWEQMRWVHELERCMKQIVAGIRMKNISKLGEALDGFRTLREKILTVLGNDIMTNFCVATQTWCRRLESMFMNQFFAQAATACAYSGDYRMYMSFMRQTYFSPTVNDVSDPFHKLAKVWKGKQRYDGFIFGPRQRYDAEYGVYEEDQSEEETSEESEEEDQSVLWEVKSIRDIGYLAGREFFATFPSTFVPLPLPGLKEQCYEEHSVKFMLERRKHAGFHFAVSEAHAKYGGSFLNLLKRGSKYFFFLYLEWDQHLLKSFSSEVFIELARDYVRGDTSVVRLFETKNKGTEEIREVVDHGIVGATGHASSGGLEPEGMSSAEKM